MKSSFAPQGRPKAKLERLVGKSARQTIPQAAAKPPAGKSAQAEPQFSATPAKPTPAKPTPAKPMGAKPASLKTPTQPVVALAPPLRPVRPPARASHARKRHWAVLGSFILMVLIPGLAAAWYLWVRAADQYASTVAFSVRKEQTSLPLDILGGLGKLSSSSSSDTDVLYEFLRSQELVEVVDKKLGLAAMWSKGGAKKDPLFVFQPTGKIEDLVAYWGRMVHIYYNSGSGLIELRVNAFTPRDARTIAREIFTQSSVMINNLSAVARKDTIRFARDERNRALTRLKAARGALTAFRTINQIVDPRIDIQGQAGLVASLQTQLADALIEGDILSQTTRKNDPRVIQSARRIRVIRNRIKAERNKVGMKDGVAHAGTLANIVGNFERLTVDREFAETAYRVALSAYDVAQAESRHQSRYLAAHIRPTLAQKALYPNRETLLGLTVLFLFLTWSILVLVAYSLKDRR